MRSSLAPSPIVFCFDLGSSFAQLYLLLLRTTKEKKHTPKNRWLGILRKVMLAWHAKGDAGARFREREMWDVWKSLFLEVVNKLAPMKKRKVKSKCSPITAELRRKMRKRDFLKSSS